MADKSPKTDQVERDGWTKRFVANEPRLSEAVDMYRDSGFEVHLKPLPKGAEIETQVSEDEEGECLGCFEGFEDQYKIIYTRLSFCK